VQRADAVDLWPIRDTGKVEAEADLDDGLRMGQDFVHHTQDLAGGVDVEHGTPLG